QLSGDGAKPGAIARRLKTDGEAIDRFRRNRGVGDKGWYGRRYGGFEHAYAGGKFGVMELCQQVPIRIDRSHVDCTFQYRIEDLLHGAEAFHDLRIECRPLTGPVLQ